jgi:hypothetical protein
MVQLVIVGLSGLCFLIGLWRYFSPPAHVEAELLTKHKKEAIKLIIASAIAGAIGVGISFM